jgi:2-C-methyl-D-erythritol 2,4-cyclodiphosphate synthase
MKIGIGYDVHALGNNRKLIIGGVEIPFGKGLLGHSDADVLIHAIMDAILGAINMGSIGDLFPDSDQKYKDISSIVLLEQVNKLMREKDYQIENIDCVVMAQEPKLKPYIMNMRKKLAETLQIDIDQISIKATTTEKLGFVGREEGIAAQACTLLQ